MASKKPITARIDLAAYPYTVCREQHIWAPYDGTLDHKAGLAFRIQKCKNCPTKKHSILSLRKADYGQLVSSSYSYPNDYQIKGGVDKADRGHFRMSVFLSEIEGGAVDA